MEQWLILGVAMLVALMVVTSEMARRQTGEAIQILGGYGYQPALASMEDCVAAAVAGRVV